MLTAPRKLYLAALAGAAFGVLCAEPPTFADKPARMRVSTEVVPACNVSIGDLQPTAGDAGGGTISVSVGCVSGAEASVTIEEAADDGGPRTTFYEDANHKVALAGTAGPGNTQLGNGATSDKTIHVKRPAGSTGKLLRAVVLF